MWVKQWFSSTLKVNFHRWCQEMEVLVWSQSSPKIAWYLDDFNPWLIEGKCSQLLSDQLFRVCNKIPGGIYKHSAAQQKSWDWFLDAISEPTYRSLYIYIYIIVNLRLAKPKIPIYGIIWLCHGVPQNHVYVCWLSPSVRCQSLHSKV